MDKKLKELNIRIINLQKKLLKEIIQIDKMLIQRVKKKDDILYDYELELEINFFLNKDDPSYKEDDDNILTMIVESFKGISQKDKYPYTLEVNHNDFYSMKEHIMKDEYHCWWYHCLYDHNNLSWEDMKRIGDIWSDIKVQYQYLN